MPDIDKFFDEIDSARSRRARELSDIQFRFTSYSGPDPSGINSRAVIVLTYASWEGFYNECARVYVRFLRERGGKVRDSDWRLLLGALKGDFESLRARNHSDEAREQFVHNLKARLECGFEAVDGSIIEARSNLNFARLSWNLGVLNFNLTQFQRYRIRMDRELVQWRHLVAHGEPPDLSALSISGHVHFAAELLITLADGFQMAMLQRM